MERIFPIHKMSRPETRQSLAAVALILSFFCLSVFHLPEAVSAQDRKTSELRQFKAELHGVICKPCLKSLGDELRSTPGVRRAKIKRAPVKKGEKRFALIKVDYEADKLSRDDLVELIEFRDMKALGVEDTPEESTR